MNFKRMILFTCGCLYGFVCTVLYLPISAVCLIAEKINDICVKLFGVKDYKGGISAVNLLAVMVMYKILGDFGINYWDAYVGSRFGITFEEAWEGALNDIRG